MTLQDAVQQILQQNSGGVKFMEMLPELITMSMEGKIEDFEVPKVDENISEEGKVERFLNISDLLLARIEKIKKIQILTYYHHLSGKTKREKYFVYTE